MTNGFRQQPQVSKKDKIRSLEAEVKNLQMALRISQMMTQQMMQNVQTMSQDLGNTIGLMNELQYKLLAVQELAAIDPQKMADLVNSRRLKDFEEASAREDKEGNFTDGEVAEKRSTIILTSTAKDANGKDVGIFRSRINLGSCGVPDIIEGFEGRPVGAKIITTLNGAEHEIELLAIKNPPTAELVAQPESDNLSGEVAEQVTVQ